MRKIIMTAVAAALIGNVYAQEKLTTGYKFFNNWYGGAMTGITTSPLKNGVHPAFGLTLGKQITPNLGVAIEGITGINTTPGKNAFDDFSLTINGKLNMMNLIGGYKGSPRLFEIESVFGIGWGHEFYNSSLRRDDNKIVARAGAAFNFNLGKDKQWTLGIRPAYLAWVDGKVFSKMEYGSRFELMVSGIYHFKAGNDKRHHSVITAYTQSDVDRLNDNINDMRNRVSSLESELDNAKDKNAAVIAEMNDYKAQKEAELAKKFDASMEPVVAFRQSKAYIGNEQLSNLESIANYMKKYPEIKLDIKGYASPEGNKEFNQKLSERRANAIKDALVEKYGIEESRITATGMGVGDNFTKPEMNRAVIATFHK